MRKFEFRPWGWYITLDEGVNYKVKKIHLKISKFIKSLPNANCHFRSNIFWDTNSSCNPLYPPPQSWAATKIIIEEKWA